MDVEDPLRSPVNQAGYSGDALCTVRLPSTCSSSSLHDAIARDDDIFLHFALESLQNTMLPKKRQVCGIRVVHKLR